MVSSSNPQVSILEVNQLPRLGELGTNAYTGASFTRSTTLGVLETTQKLGWSLSITYICEDAQFSVMTMQMASP
ncbi:hypothetical protein AMTR_s00014p00175850 [Amborella trichopoda]|uniref:Uncharacterized protein n=1 Tax=Amborella trichopoda TaxID=13333 RepID=W1PM51_AMBTC|nr:hypothetical protein AMTR_s00014p00175850 [Amborella trichopoda]